MDFFIRPDIAPPPFGITHRDKLLLIGSCFTSNVGKQLEDLKFSVAHNPTGILFDPFSVVWHLQDAWQHKKYNTSDLALRDEVWHSYNHHTDFSSTNAQTAVDNINAAIENTGQFLRKADVLFITLGSAYYYRLKENNERVANCHRFPSQTFTKHLAEINEMVNALGTVIGDIRKQNPGMKVVFTVSPVRHIREGVVNNNRSKARLLETVHQLCDTLENTYYFPAYELVIDVLRDYRFYDVDMVHPNYPATQFVFEQFKRSFFNAETLDLCEQIKEVVTAYRHKPNFPDTEAHRKFLKANLDKIGQLEKLLSAADWEAEKRYFQS